MRVKPILFNTDMVRAIQANRKTVTRRVAFPANALREFPRKDYPNGWWFRGRAYRTWGWVMSDLQGVMSLCKYRPGDILYVRETWCRGEDGYSYRADYDMTGDAPYIFKWRPSIHMPREAARIFLRVTDVWVQRLKDVTEDDARAEGFSSRDEFIAEILKMYPDCTEESWFWVIEFERISREEVEGRCKSQ